MEDLWNLGQDECDVHQGWAYEEGEEKVPHGVQCYHLEQIDGNTTSQSNYWHAFWLFLIQNHELKTDYMADVGNVTNPHHIHRVKDQKVERSSFKVEAKSTGHSVLL